jgi:hypothetical protein
VKSSRNAKDVMLAGIRSGLTVKRACEAAERGTSTFAYYKAQDPEFRRLAEAALTERAQGYDAGSKEVPDFPEFCEKYLDTKMFWHHLQWYDLLEGREPRDLHSSQRFVRGDADQLLVNTPPEHCPAVDTPVLTADGWKTIGEVTDDDLLPHRNGRWYPILRTWEPDDEVPVFRVTFGNGSSVTTDAAHKWNVQRSARHPEKQMTTAELMADLRSPSGQLKWRVRQAAPLEGKPVDLPIDPYVFGYWLGDGETGGSRFACSSEDRPNLEQALGQAGYPVTSTDERGTYATLYPAGLRTALRKLEVMDCKRIPAAYEIASIEQRLELLRGLMDADGTITAKDGRARFCQDAGRVELNRQVFRLVASLGFQPRMKTYSGVTEISFKPDAETSVFRLERKACRQFTRARSRRTDFLAIQNVEPAGEGRVRCLTVLSDDNTYLVGDSLISTRNGKSTTLTVNYVTWRIVQDPNVRILLISKTQDMAKRFLMAIKDRLSENERYADLQRDFGPIGGWAENAIWAAEKIRVNGADSGEHAYTVQAVGIGGHIYGTRTDLAIMDDCIDHTNHQQYDSQINWIQNQVGSRVADAGGRMLLVGTRLETVDLYSEILKPSYYVDGESPWTYLTQPAVLEYADDPKDWKTLWPVTNRPPVTIKGRKIAEAGGWPREGMWPMWHGQALARKRRKMRARNWSMVYMQDQVADDSTFRQEDVQGCVDRARYPGRLMPGQADHRPYGMEGLTVIAGLDPAAAGYTAIQVWGLDRQTKVRWVLEVLNKKALPPHLLREEMFRITERYGVSEWRIEKNAYQASIVQERLIRDFMNARGVLIGPHTTDAKKWDSDFGVASMATLFDGWQEKRNLIRLPSQTQSEPVRNFAEQLCAWTPETKGLTDTVMAAWFVEIRCRELMADGLDGWHSEASEFMSQRDREGQMVVDIEMALQQGAVNAWDGSLNGFSGPN